MRRAVIHCDLCQAQDDKARVIFGVDLCSSCYAARAGEALDLLHARSKVQPFLDLASQYNPQNNPQANCK